MAMIEGTRSRITEALQQSPLRAYWVDDSITPLKLLSQDVFKAIKDQPWVKRPEQKQHDPFRSEGLLLFPWIARDIGLPSVGPSASISRSCPVRISSGIRPYTRSRIRDRMAAESSISDSMSLSTKQLINTNPTDKNREVSLANNTPCISFHFYVFY